MDNKIDKLQMLHRLYFMAKGMHKPLHRKTRELVYRAAPLYKSETVTITVKDVEDAIAAAHDRVGAEFAAMLEALPYA